MKLYRLERYGLGPFSQHLFIPTPEITGESVRFKKGDNKRCFLYACESELRLREYFGEEFFSQLIAIGFEVKEYEVPLRRIRESRTRVEHAFHLGSTDAALILNVRMMFA